MTELASQMFAALGTTAVVVTDRSRIAAAVAEVREEVAAIDRTCSRFRADSDLSRVNRAGGVWTRVDRLLIRAIAVAIRAARLTDGLVDPTVGGALIRLGYDRDFTKVAIDGAGPMPSPAPALPAADWRRIEVRSDGSQIRIPREVSLDLGSTAKALAADRAAGRAAIATGGGVLVGLGGDVAVAGTPPEDGWRVGIADDHARTPERGETVSIAAGGLASSSTTVRRWLRGGQPVHHVIDPRTGLPASEQWRTVTVCAATCLDANTASTAAIVLGEEAPRWLAHRRLPARLVSEDGSIVRVGGWPERVVA